MTVEAGPSMRQESALDSFDVFLFDVDGTLTTDTGAFRSECLVAIRKLLESGKQVGLVTARDKAEMSAMLTEPSFAQLEDEALGLLHLFPSSATHVYRIAAEGPALKLVHSWATHEHRALMNRVRVDLSRFPRVQILDRDVQLTILVNGCGTWLIRQALNRYGVALRCIQAAHNCLHILPTGFGKQHAVEYYRRTGRECRAVAIGDSFYSLPELEIHGNDVDFVGAANTCVNVGRIRARDSRVLHFALSDDGPSSTLLVLDRMREVSAQFFAALAEGDSAVVQSLTSELTGSKLSRLECSFLLKLLRYLETALEADVVDDRLAAATAALRAGESVGCVAECLGRDSALDQGFGHWSGFDGHWDWVQRWLWDEHIARPDTPFAECFSERVRAPLLPEELAFSILRTLPFIKDGYRIVLVGKDAECLLPILQRMVPLFQQNHVLPEAVPEPVALKISARKSTASDTIDAAEHIAPGSVARQLLNLLDVHEREGPVSPAVCRLAIDALATIQPSDRLALAEAIGGRPEDAFSRLSLGALIARIGALATNADFEQFVIYCRAILYTLQPRLLDESADLLGNTVASVLADLPLALIEKIECRYEANTGRSTIERLEEARILHDILASFLEDAYLRLRELEFPFTPVLNALMTESRARTLLNSRNLFVDASCNAGTTVLFLRALRKIVAPESTFEFAAVGGVLLHETLRKDLAWQGHPFVTVLMEEGAPHTFDFFYDAEDNRIPYRAYVASTIGRLSASEPGDYIGSFCHEYRELFDTFSDLTAAGVDMRDVMRWWLRRDRIWEMRVLCEQIRFRWPYARMIRQQHRVKDLFRRLDAAVDEETRARMLARDGEYREVETRELVASWLSRRERWLARAINATTQAATLSPSILDYMAHPSEARWRTLQRGLMTHVRPETPFQLITTIPD
ncbi:MAG TPA: hypothetical protein VHC69_21310 [Polyangiaceae bacterium]|nr:hypothetical protein [Polyangiaceae bacterium]